MDKSKATPVPLKWRRQALPPAPPEDGRPEEPWQEGNRSDADSEENVQFVTSRTPSSESEDFLRALPERPDDEYDDAPGRAQFVATLRELLEEEQSETSQGAPKAETARLPTPPAAPAEDLQVNEEFALEEEFQEEENIEHDVNVQLQLDDSLAMPAVEDSQQPLQEPAEKRGRLGSALRARAKAFARGRASKTDGKGKKKNKSQAQSPPASLPRANSRLSEMSSASFVFDDDEEEISSESQLKRSFRCFSCRFQCSLSCISVQIYVLALAFAVAGAIYMGLEGPEVQLGAFDLWTQVQKPGSQDARYFASARRSALGLRHVLPLGPANASAARQWHSIELFWEMGASEEQKLQDFQPEVISDAYMSRVHAAEAQVQALTGWSSFCNATPAEVQFLCRPGDSLPALAFGTWEAPNFNEQILGMKWKVWFNGQGRGTQIPVETLLTFTREVEPSLLERWLSQGAADSADQEDARRLLRSTFLFYFPSEELPSFLRFVDEELRPFLVQLQDASEEASGGLRGFVRIDGRDLRDLPRYFRHEELSICTPLITLVAVQLTTRRALLSLGAAAVVAAAVAAAAAAEGRQAAAGILAWPYLAASAVEIAIACSSIISYNRVLMMRLNVLDPKGMKAAFLWRSPWREKCIAWLQMPLQLFAPTLTAVVVLQALSSLANDVPMVQEFAGPALLGMFMILVFGPFLFVPAILLGDAAAERRLFEASGLAQLLPKEIASTPETAAQRRGRRRYALFVATRYSYWLACPTLTVSALILVVIVAANSQVLLEAETPYLFNSDHIFHRAQEVKAKAGGLPSPDVIAATVLRNASSCQIGADASLQCSWYSCTAQTSVVDLDGLCECDYRLEAAETQCYATARFAGLTEPLEGFWEWANATLASRNTSLKGARLNFATWSLASPLELEDWDSGRNFLQKQIASQLPATAPEDCFEAQCYCGSARCNRTNRWLRLGRLSAPGSNASSDPEAGGSNATETMEVVVVWGDKVGQALDLASLEAQRQLYAFCAATMPDLEILSRSCWALDFKLWLEARGEKFPVQTQDFWAILESFAADEGMEKYFWYETGVGLVGTFAIFSVPLVSEEEAATVRGRWESYLSLRPGIPSQPWLVAEALQVGYISASLSEEGSTKIGVVQFDSAESAFQAAHARKGSSWDPATGPVLLRPVSSRASEMTRRRMQPLNLSEIRSGSSPRPTTPRSWRDVRAGSSPRTTTPRSWSTESTNVTPRTRPNSPVRQSFGLSFRSSLHVLPTPETAKKALPTQSLRQAKMALKRAAEKKFTKSLEDAVANARSVGLPEEDPDLERAISLLNDRLQPVDARWVTSLHTRAAAKLKHAWPSRREEKSLTPRQRRAALQDALCAAAEALTLTPQTGISSLQKKTEKQLRSVSSRWISHAWGDLDAAFEAKDLEALCQAAEECSAAESACHAAGAQSLRPEPAMLDKLRSSLRICDGSSSFSLEAKRLHAFEEVREALTRRLGEGSKDEQHWTEPFLADALREALRQGCQAGDSQDDCIGRALGFQSRLSERLPQRWGLWSSLLLSRKAVLWEASSSLARVQKALAFSRTAHAPDLELRNASLLEEKFGRHFAAARDLDEALETDLNLAEATAAAQHVEGDGGWLLVATNLRRARRRLGAQPPPVDPQ
ncbi:unnamed protein product, partial [Symbiodinium sp. CCMP2456]